MQTAHTRRSPRRLIVPLARSRDLPHNLKGMDGLNKRFMEKPDQFLHEVALVESEELMKGDVHIKVPAGRHKFDLVRGFNGTAELRLADANQSPAEELISAYWLPFERNATTEIELGNEASYFFTSYLGGCQLRILPPSGPGGKVKVFHIAGNVSSDSDPKGKNWRASEVKRALTESERTRSRAFSSTESVVYGGYEEAREVSAVGFIRTSCWEFWAQERTDEGRVGPVWRIMKVWQKVL